MQMKVPDTYHTERSGMAEVQQRFESRLHWIFREFNCGDFGIDAQAEITRDNIATGRLLALQIKTGQSYFNEETEEGFVFRGDQAHLDYWLNHALQVVVIIVEPKQLECFWQPVRIENIQRTGKGWKMIIPRAHILDERAAAELEHLADIPEFLIKLQSLQIAKPWMELLRADQRMVLEVNEWLNTLSGRGDFELFTLDKEDNKRYLIQGTYYIRGMSYEEAIPLLFPWAVLEIDEALYDEHAHEQWEDECGIWDSEEGGYFMFTEDYRKWASENISDGLRPYTSTGEVAKWRLYLSLNELGWAYLLVSKYLQ